MITKLPLAIKIDKLTYGLIYPAFFGNMIYDLILAKTDHKYFEGKEFFIGLIIAIFYAVDFSHLYVDMEKYTGGHVENKSWFYILCDLATSILFFSSFVCIKYHFYSMTILLMGLVPIIIAIYKKDYSVNKLDKVIVMINAILCVITVLIYFLFISEKKSEDYALFFLGIELMIYFGYVFIYYEKALQQQLDINNQRPT